MTRFGRDVKSNFMTFLDNSDRWDATKSTCMTLLTEGVFAKIFGYKYDRYYKYAYDTETGTVKADRSSDHRYNAQCSHFTLGPVHNRRRSTLRKAARKQWDILLQMGVFTGCTQHQRVCTQICMQICLCVL